ncbi:hypothetical protein LEP1GSC041_0182 [Leptospira noguchii str. 2006001870]|uniref:Uncharacterized protein n=1 Tax=Leptospira noguchii serovar Autumnalis str. ZUN142 TaxID=1085540 RepID=M6UXQ4_9LEPT|nr:hypothetical protein LEP1GSC041_0182 [Leptospira noguchii str. 2006001870]EMO42068.1 hypothetical protein LEP1GSC186_2753 [Leptospira noguchii serovar Autumnalis str. ZUN142]
MQLKSKKSDSILLFVHLKMVFVFVHLGIYVFFKKFLYSG